MHLVTQTFDIPNICNVGCCKSEDTFGNFETEIDKIFGDFNNWFKLNQLTLNYNKTNYLQLNTKNSWDCELKPNYRGNCIKSS